METMYDAVTLMDLFFFLVLYTKYCHMYAVIRCMLLQPHMAAKSADVRPHRCSAVQFVKLTLISNLHYFTYLEIILWFLW